MKLRLLFTQFEDDYRRNARLVFRAAQARGVSEYELFQMAYQAWYGSESEPQKLEKLFVAYMFSGHVPAWVRDYAQRSVAGIAPSRGAVRRCLEQLWLGAGRGRRPHAVDHRRADRLQA